MDDLIDAAAMARLLACLRSGSGAFAATEAVVPSLAGHKLRERVDLVHDALILDIPDDLDDVLELLDSAMAHATWEGWALWPVGEAITTRALLAGEVDRGLDAMAVLTARFTSEFSIRRLADADLDAAVAAATEWTTSSDAAVRRLASEGLRPYLPWAVRIPELLERPDVTVAVLDRLAADPDEVVRRSAANHLNDISRHAPDVVIDAATRWLANSDDPFAERTVRHALRTLIKKGNPAALALMGFRGDAVGAESLVVIPSELDLPGEIHITAELVNDSAETASVAVDYVVHYVKANGSHAPKVFKLTTLDLAAHERRTVVKRHGLRPMTTRRHYAGVHRVELQLNGRRSGEATFTVSVPADESTPGGAS